MNNTTFSLSQIERVENKFKDIMKDASQCLGNVNHQSSLVFFTKDPKIYSWKVGQEYYRLFVNKYHPDKKRNSKY